MDVLNYVLLLIFLYTVLKLCLQLYINAGSNTKIYVDIPLKALIVIIRDKDCFNKMPRYANGIFKTYYCYEKTNNSKDEIFKIYSNKVYNNTQRAYINAVLNSRRAVKIKGLNRAYGVEGYEIDRF